MVAFPDTTDVKAGASALAAEVAQLKSEVEKLSGSILGLGRDGIEATRRSGTKQLGAWRDDVDDLATSLKKQGLHQLEVVESQVRERPILTLLAVLGVGLLVKHLIDRR